MHNLESPAAKLDYRVTAYIQAHRNRPWKAVKLPGRKGIDGLGECQR